jgi:hypothetical protein
LSGPPNNPHLFPSSTQKAGYYIAPDQNIGFFAELMNMHDEPRAAYITMTFEFIRGMPAGFSQTQSLWLDIGGCHSSELPAKPDAHFDYSSPEWSVPRGVGGKVTYVAGHLHDGGTRLEVSRNGDVVCVSKAEYGRGGRVGDQGLDAESMVAGGLSRRRGHESEHGDPAHGVPGMNMSSMHISRMSACEEDVGRVQAGDTWSVTAHYNTKMHGPMVNADGSLEPIMGIALVYVADELSEVGGRR